MRRAALLLLAFAGAALQPAAATDYHREDLRIPMEAAGPCGLEAMCCGRAFAVSPKGAFAFRSGRRSTREATEAALAACAECASDCPLDAVDDHLAETASTGSREYFPDFRPAVPASTP